MAETYKECTIEPVKDPDGRYFGIHPDNDGYQTFFVRVIFPNGTWVYCANVDEARKYIDKAAEKHGKPENPFSGHLLAAEAKITLDKQSDVRVRLSGKQLSILRGLLFREMRHNADPELKILDNTLHKALQLT